MDEREREIREVYQGWDVPTLSQDDVLLLLSLLDQERERNARLAEALRNLLGAAEGPDWDYELSRPAHEENVSQQALARARAALESESLP